MKSTSSAEQISAIFFAIRHTNFSDSITHGPRMNAGRFPPIVTLPTRNGFVFTVIITHRVIPSEARDPQSRATLLKLPSVTNHRIGGSSPAPAGSE